MKILFAVAAVLVGTLAYVLGNSLTASGQTIPPPAELPQPYLGLGGSTDEMEIEIRFPDYDPDYVGTMKIANESALYPNASFRWVPP